MSHAGLPVVAEIVRSGFVEGHHYGSIVALAADGTVDWSVGEVVAPVLPRSSNKPIQALAMVELGLDLPPDLVFLVFLPALLYRSSFLTTPQSLRRNATPIALLSVGLVLATAFSVAAVASVVVPGFGLAEGLVLGAVLEYADGAFNELLKLGFGSSIRREWAWRTKNDLPKQNLEAFENFASRGTP